MPDLKSFRTLMTNPVFRYLMAIPLCLLGRHSDAAIINVPGDQPTIQAAIDAAQSGDSVLVAPGVYHGILTISSKNIILRSTSGPEVTELNGDLAGPVISTSGGDRTLVVDGFTIRNGMSSNGGGLSINGGAPSVLNNVIVENRGASGNGIRTSFSGALIRNNIIRNNTNMPGISGGGGGGGLYIGGASCNLGVCAEIVDNLIEGNSVPNFLSGGGILLFASGPVRILRNTIRENTAPIEGGGIAAFNSADAHIESNVLEDNVVESSSGKGGGVFWLVPSGRRGPFLINNTIIDNTAAAGSAVYADGFDISSRISNNILLGNTASSLVHCGNLNDQNPPIIRNNLLHNGVNPVGGGLCSNLVGINANMGALPTFVPGTYVLTSDSSGIDAGLNSDVEETTDYLGLPRILNGRDPSDAVVDLGAIEYDDVQFRDGFEP